MWHWQIGLEMLLSNVSELHLIVCTSRLCTRTFTLRLAWLLLCSVEFKVATAICQGLALISMKCTRSTNDHQFSVWPLVHRKKTKKTRATGDTIVHHRLQTLCWTPCQQAFYCPSNRNTGKAPLTSHEHCLRWRCTWRQIPRKLGFVDIAELHQ